MDQLADGKRRVVVLIEIQSIPVAVSVPRQMCARRAERLSGLLNHYKNDVCMAQ